MAHYPISSMLAAIKTDHFIRIALGPDLRGPGLLKLPVVSAKRAMVNL